MKLTRALLMLVAMLMSSIALAQSAPGSTEFAEGVKRHDGGAFAEAIPLFKAAIDLGYQPANQARFRLARAYARAGQPELALAELETIAKNGFPQIAALTTANLDSLRTTPRFQAVEKTVNANAHPCAADPNFRAFDFWIGEWDVQPTGPNRAPIGQGASSRIEKQLDGCVIQENWLPLSNPIGAGKSFNTYNTSTKLWEQYYVDQRGTITHYTGTFHADGNLYYEADQFGTRSRIRMTFFNQGPNQVRQLGHISTDGGNTWAVTFDLTYIRKL